MVESGMVDSDGILILSVFLLDNNETGWILLGVATSKIYQGVSWIAHLKPTCETEILVLLWSDAAYSIYQGGFSS